MSDYVSKKAIRYKFKKELTEEEIDKWFDYYGENSLQNKYNLKHKMQFDMGLDEKYLDIVLKSTYGTICGDFGSSRKITDEECNEYLEDFKKVIPDITKDDLRYVFYCYYNGVDAPDCYEVGEWNYDD